MSRAQQFEIFAAGAMYNGAPVVDGYVRFYEAGTTTLKNAWEDADKSVACTTKQLDTQGRAEVYGDGIYKLLIYAGNPATTGVLRAEIDFYKCTALVGNRQTVTGNTTVTRDDEVILANTAAGNITLTLDDVATFDRSVVIKKIHAANSVFIVTTASQLIDALTDLTFTRDGESVELVPDHDGDLWRRSNELAGLTGLTATAEEINAAATFVDEITAEPEDIDAAAEFVDDLTITPAELNRLGNGEIITVDLSAGISNFSTENGLRLMKVGKVVYAEWDDHAHDAGTGSVTLAIPEGYRPNISAGVVYDAYRRWITGMDHWKFYTSGTVTVNHFDFAGEVLLDKATAAPGSIFWFTD